MATTTKARPTLTPRQREVLLAYAMGEKPGEVAARLGVSVNTVSDTAYDARKRLGARTMINAVIIAYDEKLIP